jgi:hypothetical protein
LDFWEHFFNSSWLQGGMVVIGGDLNFSLGASEIWGPVTQLDNLSYFFIEEFGTSGIIGY